MFTLAHLSDPHLAPLPAPRWSELIGKRVTGYINWQRRRRFIHDPTVLAKIVADMRAQAPGHIAVTGDLTNIALPEEFMRGRTWLASLGAPPDVTVIPGNHDAYVRAAAAEPERCWGEYMRGDDPRLRGDERQSGGFPFVRRRGPLALVGLSTALPTAPFMATGRLGGAQLKRLGETLVALAREKVFRVVLIHHPPVSQAKRHKLLTDAAEFLRVIATHGAELVLHGHDHLHMLNWLSGPNGARVPAVGVPSASAAWGMSKDAAAYNLYAIDGAPGAWTCELISRGVGRDGTVMQQRRAILLG
jgi:3',5'-cyclic AMP phosphodiesterase CpdA